MIRALRSEDRASVIDLVRATGNFNEAEVAIAKELIDIAVEQPTQKDYNAFVDVEPSLNGLGDDESIAGFLIVGPTPATVGTYDMYWIAVHPTFQGRGIAQALDTFATQFVINQGGYWLIAETSGQPGYDRTRAFYVKQGYATLSRIPDYYKPGDDLIVFGKRLG